MSTFLDATKVFQYGKTTIPKSVRVTLGIKDGDSVVWMRDETGRVTIMKRAEPTQSKFRMV